jgi:hypothetical protein
MNRKAELEADLEAEALLEAVNFCWKRKRRKRKRLGWKGKWKRQQIDHFLITDYEDELLPLPFQ